MRRRARGGLPRARERFQKQRCDTGSDEWPVVRVVRQLASTVVQRADERAAHQDLIAGTDAETLGVDDARPHAEIHPGRQVLAAGGVVGVELSWPSEVPEGGLAAELLDAATILEHQADLGLRRQNDFGERPAGDHIDRFGEDVDTGPECRAPVETLRLRQVERALRFQRVDREVVHDRDPDDLPPRVQEEAELGFRHHQMPRHAEYSPADADETARLRPAALLEHFADRGHSDVEIGSGDRVGELPDSRRCLRHRLALEQVESGSFLRTSRV